MIYAIISFLGLLIGIILAEKFKGELKNIKNFLRITGFIIILIIILRLIFIADFDLMFLLGIILGLAINYFLKNNYLYYGFILTLSNNIRDQIYFSFMTFILGLNHAALNLISKKKILLSLILFLFPFAFIFIGYNLNNLFVGFSVGGLIYGFKQFNSQIKK